MELFGVVNIFRSSLKYSCMKHIVFDCDGTLINPHTPGKPLYSGVYELLQSLKLAGHALYVWTGRDRASTLRILKENQVLGLFEDIFCCDDGERKPHSEGLKKMLPGIPKERICVIGDTFADVLGAKHFGVTSIVALWSHEVDLVTIGDLYPDFLVKDPEVCSKVITLDWRRG